MEKRPIIPVPADAPPMSFKHPQYGTPSRVWPYHLVDGGLAGYIARFDFVKNSVASKSCLPVTFCDLGNGCRGWRSKGIPTPRPLYRLPELLRRPDAPILVTEGEKAADAAQRLFSNYAVTTPMHGAKSPAKTDWSPLKNRAVTIWPDHDQPGADFARSVAKFASDAGASSVAIVDVPPGLPHGWDLADDPPDGVTVDQVHGLLEAAPAWAPGPSHSVPRGASPRRIIRAMKGDLAEATEAALSVLGDDRDWIAAVYMRGNILVRPIRIDNQLAAGGIKRPMGALCLHIVEVDWLRLRLAQLAEFYVRTEDGIRPIDPPIGVCRCLFAATPWAGVPPLLGIIETPIVTLDGRVVQDPGYDATTGLLFDAGATRFPRIPERPTRAQAEAALKRLHEPFKDFPFIDKQSLSVVLCAVLSVLVRRILRAAPLFALDAPKMASGKTLIATVCGYIATGRAPYLMPQVIDPTDERKRILSLLLEAPSLVVIDNLETPLKSDALCTVLTVPVFTDRLLGVSRTATVPSLPPATTWSSRATSLRGR